MKSCARLARPMQTRESAEWLPWQLAHLGGFVLESSTWSEPLALSTSFTDCCFCTILFMVSKPLTIVASEWIGYVWIYFYEIVADFEFFGYLRFCKCQNICICRDNVVVTFWSRLLADPIRETRLCNNSSPL